jgi:Flp pilus assembly protein TadG
MNPSHSNARKGLVRDQRGAVLAEFVIAVVPLMMTFFGFMQVSKIFTAGLGVRHAAVIAARTASVYSNRANNNPGAEGDGQSQARQAAGAALAPWISDGSISSVTVNVDDRSSRDDPYGPVQVQVTATYNCKVPMMGKIMCAGGRKTISTRNMAGFSAQMPHQGAKYEVE